MIEHENDTFLAPPRSDTNTLQERAHVQRNRQVRFNRSLDTLRPAIASWFSSPVQAFRRLPTRYIVHTVIALAVPVAIGLSQLPAVPVVPQVPHIAVVADAPLRLGPLATNEQQYNLDLIGDLPLQPSDAMPMPMSLTSRSEALSPIAVSATILDDVSARLRNGPSIEYDSIGELTGKSTLQVIGRYGDWFQVQQHASSAVAWVPAELVDIPQAAVYALFEVQEPDIPPPPPPKVGTVLTPDVSLRDGPGANYVRMAGMDAGQELSLVEQYENWLHVANDTIDGWVEAEELAIANGVMNRIPVAASVPDPNPALVGVVHAGFINVREGPGTAYPNVGSLDVGSQVNLLATYNGWYKVGMPDSSSAWVFSDLLSVEPMASRRVASTDDIPSLPAPVAVADEMAEVVYTVAQKDGVGDASYSALSYDGGATYTAQGLPASGDVASFALQFVGNEYVYGGASPGAFDCSGLVMYVYAQYGVYLPHNAAAQYSTAYGALVENINNLAPGDMVFFAGTGGPGISHVGLYIGGGRFVHAMMPGLGVQVSSLWEPYWMSHYYGGIRVRR